MILLVAGAAFYIPNEIANDGVFSPQILLVPGFATVGAIVAARTSNRIGWLYLTLGLVAAITLFAGQLDERVQLAGWDIDWVRPYAAWLGNWTWPLNYVLLGMSLLLFPDGSLPSPRWRWVAWTFCLSWGVLVVGTIFQSEQLVFGASESKGVSNPFAIPGTSELLDSVAPVLLPIAVSMLAAVSLAPIARYRRADRTEKQQIKWLAYTLVVVISVVIIGGIVTLLSEPVGGLVMSVSVAGVTMGVPASVGVAILRYRLYDIDLVLNRALVYGALSAILAAAYLVIVVLLQNLLAPFTAESDVAVAGSTLAVAGLFRPVRARVQAFIDRRFYRHKYDASETVQRFAQTLRDQVDLASLRRELVGVVQATMQPTRTSLWLRDREVS